MMGSTNPSTPIGFDGSPIAGSAGTAAGSPITPASPAAVAASTAGTAAVPGAPASSSVRTETGPAFSIPAGGVSGFRVESLIAPPPAVEERVRLEREMELINQLHNAFSNEPTREGVAGEADPCTAGTAICFPEPESLHAQMLSWAAHEIPPPFPPSLPMPQRLAGVQSIPEYPVPGLVDPPERRGTAGDWLANGGRASAPNVTPTSVLLCNHDVVLRSRQLRTLAEDSAVEALERLSRNGVGKNKGGLLGEDASNQKKSCMKEVLPTDSATAPCNLSPSAKLLFSAILYWRALGGLPTLLHVGPLARNSNIIDKENCLELVFFNPPSQPPRASHTTGVTPLDGTITPRNLSIVNNLEGTVNSFESPALQAGGSPNLLSGTLSRMDTRGMLDQSAPPLRFAGAERVAAMVPSVPAKQRIGLRTSSTGKHSLENRLMGTVDEIGSGNTRWGDGKEEEHVPNTPYVSEKDEICVVVRAVLATKALVHRFGVSEVVHVLPPLPRSTPEDQGTASGPSESGSPFMQLLRSRHEKRGSNSKSRANRVVLGEDGKPLPPDYGDLLVAFLQTPGESAPASFCPRVSELESMRYRIFALQAIQDAESPDKKTLTSAVQLLHANGSNSQAEPFRMCADEFPLYRAASVGELGLAEERASRIDPNGPTHTVSKSVQENANHFKFVNLSLFYWEFLSSIQFALKVQMHKTKGKVALATNEF